MTEPQEKPEPQTKPDGADSDGDEYTPVFSPRVRTIVYVAGVVISAVAFILLGMSLS